MRCRRLVLVALLLPALAGAQESLDDLDKAGGPAAESIKPPAVEANGYASNRFFGAYVDPALTFVPTRDVPSIQELLEANVQLKIRFGDKAFFYADLSGVIQGGWLFYRDDGLGGREQVPDHDVAALKPFFALAEAYVSYSPKPWLNLLVGKRRVVWGSGFAFNPTDLLNPPRDPTNPNFQRAGAWLVRVEAPFEKFTLTLAAAPQVLYQQSGLPQAFLKYPGYAVDGRSPPDDDLHYLLAARLYALIYNADVNLFYFFSNQFQNGFRNKSRFGASFSRYFFNDYELHVEALFQLGSSRLFPSHECARGLACPDPSQQIAASRLDQDTLYPKVLVGGRTQFADESLLSIEYYYQADGYSDLEFEDFVRLLARARPLLDAAGGQVGGLGGGGGSGAVPTNFSFEPLRRHYLIVSYNKPKIADDWTVGATLIAGLRDLSGLFSPQLGWTPVEWLQLTLSGFIPIRGLPVGEAEAYGKKYSEYSLMPFDARVLFEARAFY